MPTPHLFARGLATALLVALTSTAYAVDEKIDDQDFVEEASAKGIAEIETAKLALEKSTSPHVKEFARAMIDDHRTVHDTLAALAAIKKLDVAEEAELVNQVKELILKLRGEASFDKAYANNQVEAHKATLALFRRAALSTDADVSRFAMQTLPRLEHHLQQAEELAATLGDDD